LEATLDEVVEDGAPGFGALRAHVLDCEQHLLAVRAHADDDKQRDRRSFAIEPDANDGAVEDQPYDRLRGERAGVPGIPVALHLPPYSAHYVLADRAAKQGCKRSPHPAGVGTGEVGARNQGVGSQCAPLIRTQHLAVPLRSLAILAVKPGTRHFDLHPAEGPRQRPRPMAMPVTGDSDQAIIVARRF
jgi:hypothetical protein